MRQVKKAKEKGILHALKDLIDLYPNGREIASSNPAEFLRMVAKEIIILRSMVNFDKDSKEVTGE